jgi:NAD(P)-dependent dehydrogenase (short-subunit alcohol dehydrogenase family)
MSDAGHALEGRTALVTGASRGIGRAIATRFAEEGADVAIVSRTPATLAEVVEQITAAGRRAIPIAVDVTEPDAAERIIDEAVSALGGIDILVNNAGGNSFMAPLQTMRLSGWDKGINLNLTSAVRLIHASLPHLIASDHGSLVNVASVAGLRGAPYMAHYGAAKAALISLTQSLAVELAGEGVRVNALVPGWIDTDLTDFLRVDDNLENSIIGKVPMGRWGRPEEIAAAALFLASDASSYMTGQTLVIDGGLSGQM